jgi:hypothetical protein
VAIKIATHTKTNKIVFGEDAANVRIIFEMSKEIIVY